MCVWGGREWNPRWRVEFQLLPPKLHTRFPGNGLMVFFLSLQPKTVLLFLNKKYPGIVSWCGWLSRTLKVSSSSPGDAIPFLPLFHFCVFWVMKLMWTRLRTRNQATIIPIL